MSSFFSISMRLINHASNMRMGHNKIFIRHAGRKATSSSEPKNDIILDALYPSTIRNRETPTGVWRRDVGRRIQRAIPSKQAHDTIERAWLLHKRHLRWKRDAEISRKYNCMWNAMCELEKLDPRLFKECNVTDDPRVKPRNQVEHLKTLKGSARKMVESRFPGLFPREMRVPTDTLSRTGWNYEWEKVLVNESI